MASSSTFDQDHNQRQKRRESAKVFQQSWGLYQKMVQSNGMSHNEAYGALERVLNQRFGCNDKGSNKINKPFHFLDLACGDALHSSRCLRRTSIGRYTGIDLSETALASAHKSIQENLSICKKELKLGDFTDHSLLLDIISVNNDNCGNNIHGEDVVSSNRSLDVVWIGLSLHHLKTKEKINFMKNIVNKLSLDGMFLIYEPICLPGQTQKDYYEHFVTTSETIWSDTLTDEERLLLYEHVENHDFPETEDEWLDIGKQAGFQKAEKIFTDPFRLYTLFAYYHCDV